MKFSSIFFLLFIFSIPVLSFVQEDTEKSKILNSNLQTLPLATDEKLSPNEYIAKLNKYVEDQIIGHEKAFEIKYKLDFYLGRNNNTKYYYIPKLNIHYQYDEKNIYDSSYVSGFDDVCAANPDTDFLYYVVPGKRNSIPDKYVATDYNQVSNAERQTKIKENLSQYQCITTEYKPDLLNLTDYYNYNHHYNSNGVYKTYIDFMTTYNNLYGTDYELMEPNDLKEIDVPSVFYQNDLTNDKIDNYTTERIPANMEEKGTSNAYRMISQNRVGYYQNPNPTPEGEDVLFVTDSFGQGMLSFIMEEFNSVNSVNFYDYAEDPQLLEDELENNDYDRVIIYSYDYNVLNR